MVRRRVRAVVRLFMSMMVKSCQCWLVLEVMVVLVICSTPGSIMAIKCVAPPSHYIALLSGQVTVTH